MEQVIAEKIRELYNLEVEVELSRPDAKFGDFATNVAMQLAGRLGKAPREIATELADALRKDTLFTEVSVAGPGFLNLRVIDEYFVTRLGEPFATDGQGMEIVVETNCPNPFKAMHIGHAFNAILGDTIANLLAVRGANVHRVSYHGDVGAHVGKSMYSLLRYCDGDANRLLDIPEDERNSFMSRMYADGARAAKESPEAKAEIDHLAKQSFDLEDPLYRTIYETCKGWSFDQIDATVARLGNAPTERRYLESQSDPIGVQTVIANTPGVFTQSEGAYIFEGSKHGSFDNAFVASNGRGLYAARDLGLMQLKYDDYHPDLSYTVTAEEQRDYFKGVIAAAALCLPDLAGVTQNISHGTVLLSTGKMSSRDGDVVEIDWLFDQIGDAIRARGGEPTDALIAGAIRYQFLRIKIGGDVVFDVGDAVSLQGNTGSYLQYAHARASSIIAKSDAEPAELMKSEFDAGERTLLVKISELNAVVERAADELAPHHIATYLYELARDFNHFYEFSRIIGDERESIRLALTREYRTALARGLAVLGIDAPQQM